MQPALQAKQRGIGLLELMLSLLVIAAILFLVTRYFQSTNENLRVSQAVDMINTVVDASYTWVEGQPNFSDISIAKLINAGLVPTSYALANANPWKGAIDVAPTVDKSEVKITFFKLSPQGCQALIEKTKKFAPDANCDNGQTYSATF